MGRASIGEQVRVRVGHDSLKYNSRQYEAVSKEGELTKHCRTNRMWYLIRKGSEQANGTALILTDFYQNTNEEVEVVRKGERRRGRGWNAD